MVWCGMVWYLPSDRAEQQEMGLSIQERNGLDGRTWQQGSDDDPYGVQASLEERAGQRAHGRDFEDDDDSWGGGSTLPDGKKVWHGAVWND